MGYYIKLIKWRTRSLYYLIRWAAISYYDHYLCIIFIATIIFLLLQGSHIAIFMFSYCDFVCSWDVYAPALWTVVVQHDLIQWDTSAQLYFEFLPWDYRLEYRATHPSSLHFEYAALLALCSHYLSEFHRNKNSQNRCDWGNFQCAAKPKRTYTNLIYWTQIQ